MDFPTESSLLSAIVRLRAIRKRRLEIRKEDAALEAEENEILEVGRASRPVRRKTLSGREAADPAAVAAQLGHSSVATTASFYTHAVAGAQERAAGKIPVLPR